MKITTIGIDLAKEVFQIHGVDSQGKTVLRKQPKRNGKVFCQSGTLPNWHGSLR